MEQPLTLEGLSRFHQEAIAPEFARIVATLDEHGQLHRETHGHLDALYLKLDQLQTEYHSIRRALERLERRMAMLEARAGAVEERTSRIEDRARAIEEKLDRQALQSELRDVERRVAKLEKDIEDLRRKI